MLFVDRMTTHFFYGFPIDRISTAFKEVHVRESTNDPCGISPNRMQTLRGSSFSTTVLPHSRQKMLVPLREMTHAHGCSLSTDRVLHRSGQHPKGFVYTLGDVLAGRGSYCAELCWHMPCIVRSIQAGVCRLRRSDTPFQCWRHHDWSGHGGISRRG